MTAMKKILLCLVALVAFSACTSKETPSLVGREPVNFSIDMPDFSAMRSGAIDESAINNLELWVFDQDGHFVEKSTAVLASTAGTTRAYSAAIVPSSEPRIIHFVANAPLGNESDWLGKDEKEMLPTVNAAVSTAIPMWARKTYPSVQKNSDLGSVSLLRNMVKCNLIVQTTDVREASYSIYNTLAKGTLAPFDPTAATRDLTFRTPVTTPTEPGGVAIDNSKPWQTADGTEPFYVYERDNTTSSTVPCIILKAKYKTDSYFTYYKVDFVDKNDKTIRHHLLRNHYLKVTITGAMVRGHATPELALAAPAANNVALSEEVQAYPSFSDGVGRLEVDKTFFAFANDERTATFNARYFPNQASTVQDNGKLTVKFAGEAVQGATVNASGLVTLQLAPQPALGDGVLTGEVIVGTTGNANLKRIVRIEVRRNYDYKNFTVNGQLNPSTLYVANVQGASLTLDFYLPEEFNDALLPTKFRLYTENFYPVSGQGFSFERVGGKTCYVCTLSKPLPADRHITWQFKSNRGASAETIELRSLDGYFAPRVIQITN